MQQHGDDLLKGLLRVTALSLFLCFLPLYSSYAADTTPPTGTIKINNAAQYTASTNVTLTLSATDSGSGMGTGAQMKFSNNNSIWSSPVSYSTTAAWTLTAGDGTKTVYVKFKDLAGNWSGVYSGTIILDTKAPVLVITSPANNAIVTTPSVTLRYTSDGVAKTKAFTLIQGSNTLTVSETDAAGNRATASINVILDTIAPTGTISINSGSAYTKSATVTLTLSAADAGSGMGTGAQMQFSNNGSTWSAAQAYSTTKSWGLAAGSGTKTVYVKFKDVAGNWSSIYSGTITLDAALLFIEIVPVGKVVSRVMALE